MKKFGAQQFEQVIFAIEEVRRVRWIAVIGFVYICMWHGPSQFV